MEERIFPPSRDGIPRTSTFTSSRVDTFCNANASSFCSSSYVLTFSFGETYQPHARFYQ